MHNRRTYTISHTNPRVHTSTVCDTTDIRVVRCFPKSTPLNKE